MEAELTVVPGHSLSFGVTLVLEDEPEGAIGGCLAGGC